MIRIRETILVVLTAVIVIFAFQNLYSVGVSFLVWELQTPVALIALVPLLAGLIVGGTVVLVRRRTKAKAAAPELQAPLETEESADNQQPAESSKTTD